jgi:crotonobetainyl-CoA:carnitine CoA-transferase CaiB-like acyl-CoA transferase
METGSLFSGLRVIDCASFIAAPMAATILGDFGATVIKVEPPEGDVIYRSIHTRAGAANSERNYAWDMGSRNKKGISLDLKSKGDLHRLYRLVETADVFITNSPFPARKKLMIDYESIAALNPRLIYVSFTAYGEAGPEANSPGFDTTVFWGRSGILDMMREEEETAPPRVPPGMGDSTSALAIYGGIVSALYRRERTGQGSLVTSSLLMNGAWANNLTLQAQLYQSRFPPRLPRRSSVNPLANAYRTRDHRWIWLMIVNPARQWQPLLGVLALEHVAGDVRFATPKARSENAEALIALLDQGFSKRDLIEWKPILDSAGITFGMVSTVEESACDPQMIAAKALVPFRDGSALTVNSPFEIEGITKVAPTKGPSVGQHNDEILRSLGETGTITSPPRLKS